MTYACESIVLPAELRWRVEISADRIHLVMNQSREQGDTVSASQKMVAIGAYR